MPAAALDCPIEPDALELRDRVPREASPRELRAHPHLLAPVLQVIHRAISTFLIKQAGLKRTEAATFAVTLIQRFGSAANLNLHRR
jgi:hypothetical protein